MEGMRRPDLAPMQVAHAGERGMYFEFLKAQDEKDAAVGPSAAPPPKATVAPAKSSSLAKFMKVKPTAAPQVVDATGDEMDNDDPEGED